MDAVKRKRLVGEAKVDGIETNDRSEVASEAEAEAEVAGKVEVTSKVEVVSEGAPRKARKRKHRKFIDLQKQPPKPKPLVQE